jgi:hypothetical protein
VIKCKYASVTSGIDIKEGQDGEMEIHVVLQVLITSGIKENITYHTNLFANKFNN